MCDSQFVLCHECHVRWCVCESLKYLQHNDRAVGNCACKVRVTCATYCQLLVSHTERRRTKSAFCGPPLGPRYACDPAVGHVDGENASRFAFCAIAIDIAGWGVKTRYTKTRSIEFTETSRHVLHGCLPRAGNRRRLVKEIYQSLLVETRRYLTSR